MSGEPPMILLVAAAIGSGLVTAIVLAPLSPLAALLTAPLVASVATGLACLLIGWSSARDGRTVTVLDEQADAMVAALRVVADHAKAVSPTPEKSTSRRNRVA